MFCSLEECNGDVDHWFNRSLDKFDDIVANCRRSGDIQTLKAALEAFEKPLLHAAREGIETAYAWEHAAVAARLTKAPPAKQLAYYARAYELGVNELCDYKDCIESTIQTYFNLGDFLHEMARVHEAEGDLKMAAELYQRALQHMEDALNECDARLNEETPNQPRRPQWRASLERVKKLMGQ